MRLISIIRKAVNDRRRRQIAGCVSCGGQAIRYVYALNWRGQVVPDESYCSACGPLAEPHAIDYGRDITATVGQTCDDVTAATN